MNTHPASAPTTHRSTRKTAKTLLAATTLSVGLGAGLIAGPFSSLASAGGLPTPELPKFSLPSIPPLTVPPGPMQGVTIPPNLVIPTIPPVTIPPGPGDFTIPTIPPVTIPPGPGDLTTPTIPPVTIPPGPGDLTTPTAPPVTVPPVEEPGDSDSVDVDPVDVESATEERDLAFTGSQAPLLATIGGAILIAGLAVLAVVRRRRVA